jgi:putative membrane protein
MKPTIVLCAASLTLAWAAVWGQGGAPTDPQIAAIVVTANQVDVDAGKLAESKTQSGDVKGFAQRMVIDHTGVIKSAKELVQKLHVTPEPNATSESFQKSGDENLAALERLSGAAFDKAYIDHEVNYHEAALSALDKTLIPSAQNADLKALLVKVRPAFEAHLEHARKVQAELAKSG